MILKAAIQLNVIKRQTSSQAQRPKWITFINALKQTKHTSTGMMAIAIFSTLAILGGYRYVVQPKLNRKRFEEAQAFANYVYEQETNTNRSNEENL